MPKSLQRLAAASALAFVCAQGAAWAEDSAFSGLPTLTLRLFAPGLSVEHIVYMTLNPIRRYDRDHNGLDSADIDMAESILLAKRHAYGYSYYLARDLNGDLQVTEAEIRTTLALDASSAEPMDANAEDRAATDARVKQLMASDLDEDGTITAAEIAAYFEQFPGPDGSEDFAQVRLLLQADANSDAHVAPAELEAKVRKAFAAVDKDGDGMISKAEHEPFSDEILQMQFESEAPDCTLPKAEAGEQLWLVALSGLTIPTVTVTGPQNDTRLTRIVIEPGEAPLYVLLTKPEMIWQFEGATSRLKHLVVFTYPQYGTAKFRPDKAWSGAGVVGLPKERITFLPQGKCGSSFAPSDTPEGKALTNRLLKAAGVTEYRSLERGAVLGVTLPSGAVLSPADERDYFFINNQVYLMGKDGILQHLEGEAANEARGKQRGVTAGIVKLDPNNVISSGRVEADPGAKLPTVTLTP